MRKLYIIGLIGVAVLIVAIAYAEQITFSTYYPAPYGVYNEMRATRMAVGDTYIDSAANSWGGTIDSNADLVVEGNLGIGTTAPQAQLDISDPSGARAQIYVRDSGSVIKITNEAGENYIESGVTTTPGSAADLNFTSMQRSNTWMTIKDDGKVGIGTMNPQAQLHVGGTAGSDGIMFPDGTVQTTAAAFIQTGKTLKNAIFITVTFPQAFSAIPNVVVAPHWDGHSSGVGFPETINTISRTNFTLASSNAAANYYVQWIAIGPK
jgi:hypothetical protein